MPYDHMRERRKNNKKFSTINNGSAALIMIFTVLCLAMFAVLTYISANAEYKLTNKYALAVEKYYNADFEATKFIADIKKMAAGGRPADEILNAVNAAESVTAHISDGVLYIEKIVNAGEKTNLILNMEIDGTDIKVTSYKIYPIPEESAVFSDIELWSGF